MDELWQEFCNGIASALGQLFIRTLFTKNGFIAISVLGLGIVVVYSCNLSATESQAKSIVKDQCRNAWFFYYKNGRMPYTNQALGHNSTYNFGAVATRSSNVSIIAAQSIKSDFSNFVGIAFGPARNQGYSCTICKSDSYSNRNLSLVSTNGGLGCPNGYREVERIKP
jgi:hypothetical protein